VCTTVPAMDSLFAQPPLRRSTWATRARAVLASASLLLAVGCSESAANEDVDASAAPALPSDSGSSVPPSTVYDAGGTPIPVTPAVDAGKPITAGDAGAPGTDAGPTNTGTGDASVSDGGFNLPDLGTLFPPASDAGTTPKPDGGTTTPGARDPNGPCKDLNLLCFDGFDMFIINPSDCFTCNGGKGCQACILPFAI